MLQRPGGAQEPVPPEEVRYTTQCDREHLSEHYLITVSITHLIKRDGQPVKQSEKGSDVREVGLVEQMMEEAGSQVRRMLQWSRHEKTRAWTRSCHEEQKDVS